MRLHYNHNRLGSCPYCHRYSQIILWIFINAFSFELHYVKKYYEHLGTVYLQISLLIRTVLSESCSLLLCETGSLTYQQTVQLSDEMADQGPHCLQMSKGLSHMPSFIV